MAVSVANDLAQLKASSIADAAVAAGASSDAHASAALLEQEQLNAALLEETKLLHQHLSFNKVQQAITSSLGLHIMPGQELSDRVPSGKTLKQAMDKIVDTVNKLQARPILEDLAKHEVP
ncbi:hypothetical protein HaLaN_15537, partial [Haematococcus lacustris]